MWETDFFLIRSVVLRRTNVFDALLKPLDSFLGHVFHIEKKKNKTKWNRMSEQSVNVSILYDENEFIYKIFSMENENVLINSTLTSAMQFTKTTQTSGHWLDAKMSSLYGIDFTSESTLNLFNERFNEFKENVRKGIAPRDNGKYFLPSPIQNSLSRPSTFSFNRSVRKKNISFGSTNSIEEIAGFHSHTAVCAEDKRGKITVLNRKKSLKDEQKSPRSHRSSNSSTVDSNLKYENGNLQRALTHSMVNAMQWECKFDIMKKKNSRLFVALQNSSVEEQKWKERVRLKGKISHNTPSVQELEMEALLADLNEKDERIKLHAASDSVDVTLLMEEISKLRNRLKWLQQDNIMLKERINQSVNTDIRLKQINDINGDIDRKLSEIISLHKKMSSLL